MNGKREFGDYQTPSSFAAEVCKYLKDTMNLHPDVVVEPTCGTGTFLHESLSLSAGKYYGIEINETYCGICREEIQDQRVEIIHADFFSFQLFRLLKPYKNILIIGNPPWVTNSDLSDSSNLPEKNNFKKQKGIEAITGSSNFDICEYMILKMIHECKNTDAVIAMLCKTSVARNVYQEIIHEGISFSSFKVLGFNASEIFGVSTSACLLVIRLSRTAQEKHPYEVAEFNQPDRILKKYLCKDGLFYPDVQEITDDFDGHCCFEWRQGIKHDCSKVVELSQQDGAWINGLHEKVSIEHCYVYPLIKSSMIKAPVITDSPKSLIVTQKKPGEETGGIAFKAPGTWNYLLQHEEFFSRRKSIIYSGSPRFAMFGIGDYSFARYKVAISGFYKESRFALVYNNDSPVMLDDTCYFLSFSSYGPAYAAMLFLNDSRVQKFLKNIAFLDSKRPFTKKILQRLDFSKITKVVDYQSLLKNEQMLKLPPVLTEEMYHDFLNLTNLQDLFITQKSAGQQILQRQKSRR